MQLYCRYRCLLFLAAVPVAYVIPWEDLSKGLHHSANGITCLSHMYIYPTRIQYLADNLCIIDRFPSRGLGAFIGVKWLYNFAFVSLSTSVTAAADSTKLSRSLVLVAM